MQRISDPLELLTAQHDRLDQLIAHIATANHLGARAAAFDRFADKLVEQLAVKQELLYPIARRFVSETTMSKVLAEHLEIKQVLAELVWFGIDDAQFDGRLESLLTLVEEHMQRQEDELFVVLAQRLANGELSSLGAKLHTWFDHVDTMFVGNLAAAA